MSVAAIVILAAMGIIISRNNSEKENKESTKIETTENNSFVHNQYSKEQIKSLISNLDEVEV